MRSRLARLLQLLLLPRAPLVQRSRRPLGKAHPPALVVLQRLLLPPMAELQQAERRTG